MARSVLVDAGFLVALLSRRDSQHEWAATIAPDYAPPWRTCEAVLSEAYHLLGTRGAPGLSALLHRRALIVAFDLDNDVESVTQASAQICRRSYEPSRRLPCAHERNVSGSDNTQHRLGFPHLSPAQPADGSVQVAVLNTRQLNANDLSREYRL